MLVPPAAGDGDGGGGGGGGGMNLVETLVSMPDTFSTLVTAVTTAGLADTLSSPGPFTVFAPTNDAFAALGADTVRSVLADHELLTAILTYHVHAGDAVLSTQLSDGMEVTTVEGDSLTVGIRRRGRQTVVTINDVATVIQADVVATNGVAHVIDAVLMPPAAGSTGNPDCWAGEYTFDRCVCYLCAPAPDATPFSPPRVPPLTLNRGSFGAGVATRPPAAPEIPAAGMVSTTSGAAAGPVGTNGSSFDTVVKVGEVLKVFEELYSKVQDGEV